MPMHALCTHLYLTEEGELCYLFLLLVHVISVYVVNLIQWFLFLGTMALYL